MLFTAEHTFGDIEGKSVCDLGCGCGMLTIGCALMDASYVLGIDIDDDAIETAAQNTDEFDMQDRVDLVRADVGVPVTPLFARLAKRFDTVVLNPPFGTKNNKGIDMLFLQRALELSRGAVYSLHKSSTREVTLLFYFILFFCLFIHRPPLITQYILRKAKDWGVTCQVVAELRYNLDASYKFHKKKSVDIEVDLLRLSFPPPPPPRPSA